MCLKESKTGGIHRINGGLELGSPSLSRVQLVQRPWSRQEKMSQPGNLSSCFSAFPDLSSHFPPEELGSREERPRPEEERADPGEGECRGENCLDPLPPLNTASEKTATVPLS